MQRGEELPRHVVFGAASGDVEVEQARQGQVDLSHLVEVDPIAQPAQTFDVALLQRQGSGLGQGAPDVPIELPERGSRFDLGLASWFEAGQASRAVKKWVDMRHGHNCVMRHVPAERRGDIGLAEVAFEWVDSTFLDSTA